MRKQNKILLQLCQMCGINGVNKGQKMKRSLGIGQKISEFSSFRVCMYVYYIFNHDNHRPFN